MPAKKKDAVQAAYGGAPERGRKLETFVGASLSPVVLGRRLRQLRESFGYTQQQLANVLNIDRSTYSYYESGKTSPDVTALLTLANVFSLPIEALLGKERVSFAHDSGVRPQPETTLPSSLCVYELKRDERQLIAYFRSLQPEKQKELLEQAKEEAAANKRPSGPKTVKLP